MFPEICQLCYFHPPPPAISLQALQGFVSGNEWALYPFSYCIISTSLSDLCFVLQAHGRSMFCAAFPAHFKRSAAVSLGLLLKSKEWREQSHNSIQ